MVEKHTWVGRKRRKKERGIIFIRFVKNHRVKSLVKFLRNIRDYQGATLQHNVKTYFLLSYFPVFYIFLDTV